MKFGRHFISHRKQVLIHHLRDCEPTELTVLPQLVGLVIHSSFRHKEFLFEVSEALFPFFQLKAQFLVDF
jgi:hypothetical protein